ncbi:hypothetical protein [Bacillus altitudinis]|uniref:hypothetical protein n=1 Tax=Bacillus altitudinis TaxID=293387 RepID=UPI00059783CA|nr:hypothetical protein [Bacillus altitudinis]MCM3045751.1 hypothetical protein [Bacillus altitudinis]MCY7687587.1 hypothetical protein [Bacillus altitudinis]MCY7703063.1 hypothetical protein [Bacillus altitudinis]MEC1802913.1 hypothetical protein [Bacillus altitudinis]
MQFDGDEKHYYCCFENDNPIEIEVSNKVGASKYKIKKYVENNLIELCNKVLYLEKVLRLITNIDIFIPVIKLEVYDEERNFIGEFLFMQDFSPLNHPYRFSKDNLDLQSHRLRFHLRWGFNVNNDECK